jgi:hypothetical protein
MARPLAVQGSRNRRVHIIFCDLSRCSVLMELPCYTDLPFTSSGVNLATSFSTYTKGEHCAVIQFLWAEDGRDARIK